METTGSNENSISYEKAKRVHGIHNPLPKRLYTLPEAATYLGRTTWALRGLVWSGKIPVVRSGKRIFIDVRDMDTFVEKNKTTYL